MISVLLPTRGRPESLVESVNSLRETASRHGAFAEFEVLVATDPDDTASFMAACHLPGMHRVWVAPERYGYSRLHMYYNELARRARGDWLLLWNDDARMVTKGWDKVIEDQKPAVLWTRANHCGDANLFPAWPKAWSDAMGHVSLSPHVDLWLGQVANSIQCHARIPVEIFHDRKDVTGGHDDQTYAEGRALMPPNYHTPVHDTEENIRAREQDARTIRQLLGLPDNRFVF